MRPSVLLVVIVLIGWLLAAATPVIHMAGAGVGVRRSAGTFFFVWTLYALGVTGTCGRLDSERDLNTAEYRIRRSRHRHAT